MASILVRTNVTICSLCGAKCCGMFSMWNHVKNNHKSDNLPVKCKCYEIVTDLKEHEQSCLFHLKQECFTCKQVFKNYDKKMNHYQNSKCKPATAEGFGNQSIGELRDLCRNNKHRRRIVMNLIQFTDFYHKDSLLRRLELKNWPAFKSTQPNRQIKSFHLKDGSRVILNITEERATKLWLCIRPHLDYSKLPAKAQIGLSVEHNHTVKMDEQVSHFFQTVTAGLERMNIEDSLGQKIISIVIKLIYANKMDMKDPLLLMAWITDVLMSMGVAKLVQDLVVKRVKQFMDTSFAQADSGFGFLFSPIITLFSAVFFGKIPDMGFIGRLAKAGNIARGVLSIWSLMDKVFQKCFPILYEYFTGFPYDITKLDEILSDLTLWYTQVQEYIGIDHDDAIARDPEVCRRIERLYRQGLKFTVTANELKLEPKMISALNVHFGAIKKVFEKVERSGAMVGGPKMEPVVIQLFGRPGVGKTLMMNPLAIELLKIKGIADTDKWNQEIYNRMPEQEYWDNYFGQRMCIYDDFGQKADSETNPDLSLFEIIRTGNVAAYPLHMAALLEKNKTYFTSEAVILTTNVRQIQARSIQFPEAVRRRIDFAVEVTVLPEFADATGKIDKALVGPDFRTDIYQFQVLDPMSGEDTNDPLMSYYDFVKHCTYLYKEKCAFSERLLSHYNRIAKQPAMITEEALQDYGVAQIKFLDDSQMENNLRQRITNMSSEEMQEFVMGLEEYRDFLSDDCYNQIMIFDPITPENEDWKCDCIWDTWREFTFATIEIRPAGFDMIREKEAKILGQVRDATTPLGPVRFFLGLSKNIDTPAQVKDIRTWRQNYQVETMKKVGAEFIEGFKEVLVRAKKLIMEHPLLSAFLVMWPLCSYVLIKRNERLEREQVRKTLDGFDDDTLCNLYTPMLGDPIDSERCEECDFVRMIYEEGKTRVWGPCRCYTLKSCLTESLDHEHRGLRRGIRITHHHDCEDCGKKFQHNHKIKETDISKLYPQKCSKCLKVFRQKVALEATVHNKPQEVMIEELSKTDVPIFEKLALIQLSASADPKTRSMNHTTRIQLASQLSSSGDPKTKVVPPARIQNTAEFRKDNMGFDIGIKLLNNVYNLDFMEGNKNFASLRGFFVKGRIFLTVQHALSGIARSTHLVVWNNDKPDGFKVPIDEIMVAEVKGQDGEFKDQLLIEFPRSVQIHADVLDQICTTEEMSRFQETSGVLLTPYRKGVIQRHGTIMTKDCPLDYSENMSEKILVLRRSYYYHFETKNGDCGSPLMVVNSQIQRKICGIHVAGNYGGGFATPLNQADIREALTRFSDASQVSFDVGAVAECCFRDELQLPVGNFTPLGKSEYTAVSPGKTKLRPSMVSGEVLTPCTQPAVLKPFRKDGEMFDPTLKGLEKCGSISPPLNKTLLNIALNDVGQNFLSDPARQRVLTNMESVAGIEGDVFATPIKRTTSAGYPFKFKTTKLGKTEWLGSDEEYTLPKEIEDMMDERIQFAKNGKRYPTIWIDTLKDERRPHEKVLAGKTRVFSAGPMDYTIVFRKYFLGFLAHVSHNRNDNEVSVGTNVYSPDWTNIALILSAKGPKVIAGDFSNFDGTLHIDILWGVLDVINKWYDNEEDNQVRSILWLEIVNSIHVCRDTVYMWTHSQPSGCPATAVINSIYNSIACRYVYLLLTRGTDYATMKEFRKHVTMVAYGDDNALNISDEIAPIFNQCTMAEAFETFGMKYTDELKSGEMLPYRSLKDINYLKRWFVKQRDGQYIAPMEIKNVLEIGNWIRECADHKAATRENIENLCFELSLHKREIFDEWSAKYAKASSKRRIGAKILTFDEYRFIELVKYGRITAKTEWNFDKQFSLEHSRKEVPPNLTEAVTLWESCHDSKARFRKEEWRAQSSIASCVPLKIQANSPPFLERRSNPTSGVLTNERIATTNETETLEVQQVTHFLDDTQRTEYAKPGIKAAEEWIKFGTETMNHSIESVLERPIEVLNSEFSASFITTAIKFPDVLFQQSPNLVDKLNKFEFVRADIKIKLLFNATPFQQGKYWLFFSPFDTVCGRPRTGNLQNATGYPGVEIDIASGAPVELIIPYCSPMSHYRLTNEESTMGELVIQEIASLSSGTLPSDCSFTIMAWFTNIRTSLPTHTDVTIPSAQMAINDEQQMQTKQGVISALGNEVAVAADTVGRALPALSDITTPVSWIARAVSGVASTFGFNKPTTVADTHPYVNHPGRGYTNMDGLDNSHMLSACPDNKLTTDMSYFSSTYDEMDIGYVKKKSCIVKNNIIWTIANGQGTGLFRFANTPGAVETILNEQVTPTTLNFLASIFRYWRGGLKYRLAFAKTAFHTGRLRIYFVPAGTSIGSQPTGNQASQLHNWILDLSQSSELEFEIPYVSNTPWSQVKLGVSSNSVTSSSQFSTGYIGVEILTELRRSSSSVNQEIQGQLWHCGGEDLEFAIPEFANAIVDNTSNFTRTIPNVRKTRAVFDNQDGIRIQAVAQIFNMTGSAIDHQDQEAPPAIQMFPDSTEQYCVAEQMTIGEKITNLRQLIKRFGEYQRGKPYPYRQTSQYMPIGPYNPGSSTNDGFFFNSIVIDPAYFGERNMGGENVPIKAMLPTTIDATGIGIDEEETDIGEKLVTNAPLHYISYLYRFWRGARRYKAFFPDSKPTGGAVFRVGTNTSSGVAASHGRTAHPIVVKRQTETTRNGVIAGTVYNSLTSGSLDKNPTFETTIYPDLTGCVEFEVPYYSPLPISIVGEGTLGDETGPLVVRNKINLTMGHTTRSLDTPAWAYLGQTYPQALGCYRESLGDFRLLTAAGDDFSFGYMVGAPTLRVL